MSIIDDEGNLFGVVNVIDALAVLLILAVLVVGVAVVGVMWSDGEPETRYATIDLGEQPDYVADRIEPGDRMAVEGYDQNVTITDVYVTSTPDDDNADAGPSIVVRAAVDGELIENDHGRLEFTHAGDRFRAGNELTLDMLEYTATGVVTTIDQEGDTLDTQTTTVLLESTLPASTADAIQVDDEFGVAGHTFATVTEVRTYAVGSDQRRVQVGLELETITRGSTPHFAGNSVAIGSDLSITAGEYAFTGDVIRIGSLQEAGDIDETTVELKLENVNPDLADSLEAGMTETERGETVATVQSVESQPAEVVLESEDGNIYLREHPKNMDVRLVVDVQTVETESGLRFKGDSLREGNTIHLDFGSISVDGMVTTIDHDD
ncbi:DUF4330 family protein [Natronosalvus vescus]|uniref:DUF4330 family protein n=1 Tax=Natronosalvus vescus TaxID=2953881 RepID=UPI002090C14A|nr:DUF4330 family protein [Natronosalvus vescus]